VRRDGTKVASVELVRSRVLVVDDEPMMGMTLQVALGDRYDVVVVDTGVEAKNLLGRGDAFDVVLCDRMMPSRAGLDLHQWLEETANPLAKRMVFMTGGAYTERARSFLRQVQNECVDKPFDVDHLFTVIERVGSTYVDARPA
jgi:DNA-binding NtrC family response regulator